MSNKDIVTTLSQLQKQGVQMLITEDGWKFFVDSIHEVTSENEVKEVI